MTNRFMLRAAVYLMPIKDGQILLLRRYNTGWMDGVILMGMSQQKLL